MSEKMIDPNELGEKVVKVLKTIYDPEIPVDIYELGLIYDVFLNEDNDVKILMTLTSPNCPVAESLPQEVKDKVAEIDGVKPNTFTFGVYANNELWIGTSSEGLIRYDAPEDDTFISPKGPLQNSIFDIEVFPAPDGEDKTIQKFLLLKTKD